MKILTDSKELCTGAYGVDRAKPWSKSVATMRMFCHSGSRSDSVCVVGAGL